MIYNVHGDLEEPVLRLLRFSPITHILFAQTAPLYRHIRKCNDVWQDKTNHWKPPPSPSSLISDIVGSAT